MNPWLALASPFLLGALIIGTIKACEAWDRWQYEKARRVRNDKLAQYGMHGVKPVTKDWWLS